MTAKRRLDGRPRRGVRVDHQQATVSDLERDVHLTATDTHDGRAVVFADLQNRGVLDVVVANQKGPLLVYRNTAAPENAWIGFALEGTASNRSGVGAQVALYWDGQVQLQQVTGGIGFCAQNDRRLHFGLGADARVEKAVVRWPSGRIQTLEAPEAGRVHHVVEPAQES